MIPREVYETTIRQFFAPLCPFFDDPSVSEILVNGHEEIIVERAGRLERTPARFASEHQLLAAIRHLSQYIGRRVDRENPILEGRLPDGSRVEAILPPAAALGPHLAIRRFSRETLTIDKLVGFGALTNEAAEALRDLVGRAKNVIVAGGTGSGKTSMLNALSSFIPDDQRVLVIEDARELQLQKAHLVHLEAQPADAKGRGAVSVRDLFKATLRMRPDRIVIGEIRGGESLDLIQAMTSGHGGCMSTVHATYPRDTLTRLETMALMSEVELPLAALRQQIASAVQIIVQVSRASDGSRGVTHITEVVGYDAAEGYQLRDLFLRTADPAGGQTELRAMGEAERAFSGGDRERAALERRAR